MESLCEEIEVTILQWLCMGVSIMRSRTESMYFLLSTKQACKDI